MAKRRRETSRQRGQARTDERIAHEQSIRGIPLAELLEMARRHLVERESAEEVCGDRFKTAQFRQALFEARRRGLLRQFVILTTELAGVAGLDALAREVEEAARRFRPGPPLRVHLVFGDAEVFSQTRSRAPTELLETEAGRVLYLRNEAVLERIIDAATDWLSHETNEQDVFVPAWGKVVRKVVGGLRPWTQRGGLSEVRVVAGSGLLGVRAFADFEASNNARLAGEIFGSNNVHLLPLPFCMPGDRSLYDQLRTLWPVRETERWLAQASLVVTSLQDFDPRRYSVVRHGLMDAADAERFAAAGACGEIAGICFNDAGDEVVVPGFQFAGIRPADLKRTVGASETENPKIDKHDRRQREVVVLAGATASRLRPLSVAIRTGMVTRVFTDHVTGQALLRELERA